IYVKGAAEPDFVLREFTLSPGDIFRVQNGERGLRNLTATGYFTFASLELSHSPLWDGTKFLIRSDTIVTHINNENISASATSLQISVEERATNVLRLAALADNEF